MPSSSVKTCDRCSAHLPTGANFCSHCGSPVGKRASSPSSAVGRDVRRIVTILFADLKGSTKAINALSAEAAMNLLRPLVAEMCDAVTKQGGEIIDLEPLPPRDGDEHGAGAT